MTISFNDQHSQIVSLRLSDHFNRPLPTKGNARMVPTRPNFLYSEEQKSMASVATQVQNGDHEVIKKKYLSCFIFWFPRTAS